MVIVEEKRKYVFFILKIFLRKLVWISSVFGRLIKIDSDREYFKDIRKCYVN